MTVTFVPMEADDTSSDIVIWPYTGIDDIKRGRRNSVATRVKNILWGI